MKQKNLLKLYKQMSISDRARMALSALVNDDSENIEEILRTVPKKKYLQADNGFVSTVNLLYLISLQWGFEYWKHSASYFLLSETLRAAKTKDDSEIAGRERELQENALQKLVALELVASWLSEKHSMNKELIYRLASVEPIFSTETSLSDLEEPGLAYYEELTQTFGELFV